MRNRVLVGSHAGDDPFQIEVIVDGFASNPSMVLLPSSLRDSEDFNEFSDKLVAQGFFVLRPQPRGMGLTSAPPKSMTLATLAGDVALCIERLCKGPAIVVGHAFGHWVARTLDLLFPQYVVGVVVLAGAAYTIPKQMPEALAVAANTCLADSERLAALQVCMFAPSNDPTSWLDGWHPHLATVYREAGRTPAKETWFVTSHAPVLDLIGACDPWRPVGTRDELKKLLGDQVTVGIIENASHAIVAEQPEAVVQSIVQWAQDLRLSTTATTGIANDPLE